MFHTRDTFPASKKKQALAHSSLSTSSSGSGFSRPHFLFYTENSTSVMTDGNNVGPCVGITREWRLWKWGAYVLVKGRPLQCPSCSLPGGTDLGPCGQISGLFKRSPK